MRFKILGFHIEVFRAKEADIKVTCTVNPTPSITIIKGATLTAEQTLLHGQRVGYLTKKNAIKLINIAKYGVLTCELCKRPIGKGRNRLTLDHIMPKSKGGLSEIENLQVAHYSCNCKKGDKYEN